MKATLDAMSHQQHLEQEDFQLLILTAWDSISLLENGSLSSLGLCRVWHASWECTYIIRGDERCNA